MWYYDKYLEESSYSTVLMSNKGGNSYSHVVAKGFIDKSPEISVRHEWKEVGENWMQKLTTSFQQGAEGIVKSGSRAAANIINTIDGKDADTETLLDNRKVMSNGALLKEYDGSSVEVTIPNFYVYFIKDYSGGGRVRKRVTDMINAFNLFGKYRVLAMNTTAFPPNDFKFVTNIDDSTNVKGSFCLVNSNFILPNLLINSINIEYSNTIVADAGPLYAKVDFTFEYGRKPVPETVRKLLDGVSEDSFNKNSYISSNSLANDQLRSIVDRGSKNKEVKPKGPVFVNSEFND